MVSGLQESIDTPCPSVDPPPHVQKKHNMKLSVVAEEAICPGAIAEERFLHNHEECFKAQTRPILMTLNLVGCMSLAPWAEPASSSSFEPESPPRYSDLEEMYEDELSVYPGCLTTLTLHLLSLQNHQVSTLFPLCFRRTVTSS
ncbi:uncharacterized protein LOC110756173 [Prunus avium]|uniref:Uncharacterized protein LOC110756173 n=1 Tax=Prunus avium TaxID=42229 RepID=A0A6P5SI74_PRUAV|nr:uncharacterized protein LOC110756173 [Prunus avium]